VVQGFEHVGMTSSNLDETISFYGGLLGLKEVLVKRPGEGGPEGPSRAGLRGRLQRGRPHPGLGGA